MKIVHTHTFLISKGHRLLFDPRGRFSAMIEGRKTILVTLRQMELGCPHMEERSREIRCFSSRFMAERWLKQNGFYFGRRSFFKYEGDYGEWIHLHDASWKYIDVEIEEYTEDDETQSQYKHFHPGELR